MTTLIAAPDVYASIISMDEFKDSAVSKSFNGTGKVVTPFGAELLRYDGMPEGTLLALDKNFALEKIQAGSVVTESDKLIDRQLERAAVTSTVGFAKIFADAVIALKVS